jgi:hypothetical protein
MRFVAILEALSAVMLMLQRGIQLSPHINRSWCCHGRERCVPSCHALQGLDAAICVALALQQPLPRVCDLLTLAMQITQGAGAYLLRLQSNPLRLSQPVRRPIQAISARKQLLALLELGICVGVVRVARAKELAAIVGVRLELALGRVEVLLEVAEARVELGLEVGGDVGLFEAHLANLCHNQHCRPSQRALLSFLIPALLPPPTPFLLC